MASLSSQYETIFSPSKTLKIIHAQVDLQHKLLGAVMKAKLKDLPVAEGGSSFGDLHAFLENQLNLQGRNQEPEPKFKQEEFHLTFLFF